jgi:GTPase SAR1 family protein
VLILGDSGVGKTRLVLEFATNVQFHTEKETGWNVYFILYNSLVIQNESKHCLTKLRIVVTVIVHYVFSLGS